MPAKQKLAIAISLISALTAASVAFTLVGHEARLVDLIGLFAAGFGAGAAFVAAVRQGKKSE